MRSAVFGLVACAWLLAGCPEEVIDPSPPLATEGGSAADNPLLDRKADTCEERKNAAEAHVLDALAQAVGGCETDADCVLFDPETRCYDSCPLVIAAHARERVRQAAGDADERWCDGFETQCAGELRPAADCAAAAPRCVSGRCTD